MQTQEITLKLPVTIYDQLRRVAEKTQRPVNDILVEAIIAATPASDSTPDNVRSGLAHMTYLNDAAIWQAARTTMAPAQRDRLADLHDRQQSGPLSLDEQAEEQALLALYRETLLVRAQAAVLLKQRGYDVSDLKQFATLE